MRNQFILFAVISTVILGVWGYFLWKPILWLFVLLGPIILLGIYDMIQKPHAIMRNFPILGRGRYVLEYWRPKLYQYFIESDTSGTPISRIHRSIVYQRAKEDLDTSPFGTQLDVYAEGYEWMNHSIAPTDPDKLEHNPKVKVGGPDCTQPYEASLLNISAMSYGSLSKNAIMALNGGAKIAGFAHNTGEGGISPYHDKFGGDLIYQIGTGYFGCRTNDGGFDDKLFAERTAAENVKMIELKISQGAKPGHGGILPAKKVTPEIASIRNVEMGKDVLSPPFHKEFNTPIGMLKFIDRMRKLANGKPIGFKLCIGHKAEFLSICKAMVETKIKPDFISIDGGEGGTGAAPLEFTNSVGMPYKEGLAFACNALIGFGLKKDIKIFAAGKILTGFHMYRALALGADVCYSARGMMLALGCIQALECNKNTCPTGVTSQKAYLANGLVVSDKKERVANFHKETIFSFVELLSASGLTHYDQINRSHIYRRIEMNKSERYDTIYPYIPARCLLKEANIPNEWKEDMSLSSTEQFIIHQPLERLHI